MILVTGGLGFIGSHTVRALLDLGVPVTATSHRTTARHPWIVDARVVALDLTDRSAVLGLRDITGIIHLGGALSNPYDELRSTALGLANVLEAAATWKVRVCIASAIGVYHGADGPWREDALIPLLGAPHPIVAMKKTSELYVELAAQRGVDAVAMRIGAIFGPGYVRGRSVPQRIARAVATGTALDLTGVMWGADPDDSADWLYAADCGRAIALLATKPLAHRLYNVGSGVATRNGNFAVAAGLTGYTCSATTTPAPALDIARLATDTAFAPRWTAAEAMRDYIANLTRASFPSPKG
jgi:UDP-glucose 4-epimerase